MPDPKTPPQNDDTLFYVGLGAVAAAALGGAWWAQKRRQEDGPTLGFSPLGGPFLGALGTSTNKLGDYSDVYKYIKSKVDQPSKIDLSGEYLRGAKLGLAYLPGANLEGTLLDGADLVGARLRNANLRRAKLWHANMDKASLQDAHLKDASMQGASLKRAFLGDAHMHRADLEGADLTGAILEGADLSDADLEHAKLDRAILERVNLSGAKLEDADFSYRDLHNAKLRAADLRGADFTNANLHNVDLTGADTEGARFDRAFFDNTSMPDGSKQSSVEEYKSPIVKTKNFKKWFGKSVVKENGSPKVVFHGSKVADYIFKMGFSNPVAVGYFATDNYSMAYSYVEAEAGIGASEPGVVPVYLSIQNPMVVNWKGKPYYGTGEVIADAKKKGYDGVVIRNVKDYFDHNESVREPGTVYVWFDPSQAKSAAVGPIYQAGPDATRGAKVRGSGPNKGTFDPNKSGILDAMRTFRR